MPLSLSYIYGEGDIWHVILSSRNSGGVDCATPPSNYSEKTVQSNKDSCFRLVRRCAQILMDINEQMHGRWDTAPPTLVRNLENYQDTLTSIHEFMKILTDIKWVRRFMKKATIENAILEYSVRLDDAARSFQIATLIDIHYAISTRRGTTQQTSKATLSSPPPPYPSISSDDVQATSPQGSRSNSLTFTASPIEIDVETIGLSTPTSDTTFVGEPEGDSAGEEIISGDVLDPRGFRRYHQSEVHLKGRSQLKGGWWTGVSAAEVEGRQTIIKRYEGPTELALKAWISDVKLLQDIFHPNFPQMIGFSEGNAPTPFILLSNVQTKAPQPFILNALRSDGLAACANTILHFYQDIVDATLYIQRQKGLSDEQAQDFVGGASFRVDSSNAMILGLPPPQDGWLTVRNYGLTESLKMAIMSMLPRRGIIQYKRDDEIEDGDTSHQVSHLVTLIRGLLPADVAPITLSARVKTLIGSNDGDEDDDYFEYTRRHPKVDLRQLRLSNLEAATHDHTWNENGGIPSYKFSVGDFGYIPDGKRFKDFVVLGNVLKEDLTEFELDNYVHGTQWSWQDIPSRRVPLDPFPLPGDATCWTMAVPPNAQIDCQITHASSVKRVAEAWHYLLFNGKNLALKYDTKPEEIILVTQAGTNQDFYIKDFATQPQFGFQTFSQPPIHQRFGQPPFGQNRPGFNNQLQMHHHMLPHQNSLPTIMYLLTSPKPNFQPYWSHSPVLVPPGTSPPELKRGWTYKIGWSTGFINWIQLHPEDFTE